MRCAHESSCYLCSTGWLASWLRFDAAESWDGLISSRTECSCGMMRRAAGAVARRIETAMCTHAISSRQHFASHQGPICIERELRYAAARGGSSQPNPAQAKGMGARRATTDVTNHDLDHKRQQARAPNAASGSAAGQLEREHVRSDLQHSFGRDI